MYRLLLSLFTTGLALLSLPSLGAGSWVASDTGPRVALANVAVHSSPLAPPSPVAGNREITSVTWRYSLPHTARQRVAVRLCHPHRCLPLHGERGSTEELAGLSAGLPLRFDFRLTTPGPAVQTRGLQVIVNYREG
ncbi:MULTISPECIES: flagellar protein FlhE [unclassified Halomonas]|nr:MULTISPECIES: flagellar protein FlhE [unclassified Halomonas]